MTRRGDGVKGRASGRVQAPGEHGQAGAEILAFAFVILFSLVLVIANAWAVVDAKFLVTSAAREGVRAFTQAPTSEAARQAAVASVRATILAGGGHLDRLDTPEIAGELQRCTRVAVGVRYRIPGLSIPVLGYRVGTRTVRSTHSELVDPFRSGLQGDPSACVDFS